MSLDDKTRTELEAAVFRRLVEHLRGRADVQNIDLMNLAGFCRNCLGNWMKDAADAQGVNSPRTRAARRSTACRMRSGRRSTRRRLRRRSRRRSRKATSTDVTVKERSCGTAGTTIPSMNALCTAVDDSRLALT